MSNITKVRDLFIRRRNRVRYALKKSNAGLAPRLSVFRSNKHIYAQIIDDKLGQTVACASTLKDLKSDFACNKEAATKVGQIIAQRASEKGIKKVCFDRGGYKYHGKIASLADAAREAGLEF